MSEKNAQHKAPELSVVDAAPFSVVSGAAPPPESHVHTLFVQRERLVKLLLERCRTHGTTFVCAPSGFGKTALLLQCVSTLKHQPEHTQCMLISAGSLNVETLLEKLEQISAEVPLDNHPYIIIDDLPHLEEAETDALAAQLDSQSHSGARVLIACTPRASALIEKVDGAACVNAPQLKMQAYEYGRWARSFSISHALDIYEITQGVPCLVTALQSASGTEHTTRCLSSAIDRLYCHVLDQLVAIDAGLYRLAALFILLGHGDVSDVDPLLHSEHDGSLERLERDFPVFALESIHKSFACLGHAQGALAHVRSTLVKKHPEFLRKALSILMHTGRVDEAIACMQAHMSPSEQVSLIAYFPVQFALAGQADFVRSTLAEAGALNASPPSAGVLLALYLASLLAGDYRSARAAALELSQRSAQLDEEIGDADWACAETISSAWSSCRGIALPVISQKMSRKEIPQQREGVFSGRAMTTRDAIRGADEILQEYDLSAQAVLLAHHNELYPGMLYSDSQRALFDTLHRSHEMKRSGETAPFSLGRCLLSLDCALYEALYKGVSDIKESDLGLQHIVKHAHAHRASSVAQRARMVAATRRLLAGVPVVDERAFVDAGTSAVRESDLATQLFCLLGEGWQALALGQVVNAQFRAQQVLKLSDDQMYMLRAWAQLLERSAQLMNSSRVTIRNETELLDLSQPVQDAAEAWNVALLLSAARFDADLSVWFSLHKTMLLEPSFAPLVRLALLRIGELGDAVRRLIPAEQKGHYVLSSAEETRCDGVFDVLPGAISSEVGQVTINLFGGFRVDRNGHVLTEEIWRRKKAGVLAARLVLSPGVFVSRASLLDEMWPQADYLHSRQSLYSALSSLRAAFRQQSAGPQYILTQGDGIALNSEFVSSDTLHFNLLAREILLKRNGNSTRQIIEATLKLEQLYAGPLYVPHTGETRFFVRMRAAFESKFIDCVVRGIEAALEEGDLPAAAWLAEAALRQSPKREDVLRITMKVFAQCGRRREIVELYGAHLYYLENELCAKPEAETQRTYESLVQLSPQQMVG